ncbi:HigA family addiction module antitoxin [uncultured Aquitalea sp.]|uniref:HigA family addiction module antitoxin n=1 Tax=uncultured Aquitalea sp. TaxID=540272 RepID=UPI0025FD0357|nr:HigA family addiction module antitoxin [uncultured Aquitalea sp.]
MTSPLVSARTPLHPGRFLDSRFLAPSGMTQTDAARLLGISRRRLNELIAGKRGITPDTAIRLACLFGQSAQFWMELQSAWDLAQARRRLRQLRGG